ncbi:MAG: hypothetical protein WCZ18_07360 [Ottowia sp.]|nr:hypothetical protein [Ottowia sp.]
MIQNKLLRSLAARASILAGAALLAACAASAPDAEGDGRAAADRSAQHLSLETPVAWGGQARCADGQCRAALVDHRAGEVVVWQLQGRSASVLARHDVAYHPDGAAWLDDEHVVAAVERSQGLDIFSLRGGVLALQQQINVGFAPRHVLVLDAGEDAVRMLVTPYSGKRVSWVWWSRSSGQAELQEADWCATPWHPVPVPQAPGQRQEGLAVGCLDDGRVMWAALDAPERAPVELARFDAVPRQVAPSPSGRWLYVPLETGGRNARIDMNTGQVQYLPGWPAGAVAVAPLADDMVIWGDDQLLHLQRIAADGSVLETRWLETSGFSTTLQLIDLDHDDELDVLVLNSAGETSDVIYGPLWENASVREPGQAALPNP